MQSTRPFIMCLQISRCISSSSVCFNINREGKFMKKMMSGSRKSKRKWYENTDLHNVSINPTDKSPSMHTRRRMIIRDKLFMKHITDMISMEEVSDLMKEGIEITHVKITPDFKYVNVFYIPNFDTPLDQEMLQKCAKIIRHELSQLRVIGIVPPIQFVENKQYLKEMEVRNRLRMLNLEEDSEILCPEQMQCDISDINVDQTSHKESDIVNPDSEVDTFYLQLPMRHDVLGLDHHRIMSQITSAVSKSKKVAQRRMLDANIVNECDNSDKNEPISKKVVEFPNREEQRQILFDYLLKKRKEEQRRRNLRQKVLNNFEEIDNEESDYEYDIDDDIDGYIDDFEDETRK